MIKEVIKPQKIALCRNCAGTGQAHQNQYTFPCPQCQGSGRVLVSGKITLEIEPYNPKK